MIFAKPSTSFWSCPWIRRKIIHFNITTFVLNERHLRRVLQEYLAYYHGSRTHLGLEKDSPVPRAMQAQNVGPVESTSILGGLQHRYYRDAG